MMSPTFVQALIALGLVCGLLGSVEAGFRVGLWKRRLRESDSHLGTVQAALLGLLALLLGFAFSGAMSRFIDRQDVLVREGNAMGTAYLRADLLPEPEREMLRASLRRYADDRIVLFQTIATADAAAVTARLAAHHAAAWAAATAGVRAQPVTAALVLEPLNEIIDLLAVRNAATKRHMPALVLALLLGCAAVSMYEVGFGQGLAGRRNRTEIVSLALLIAVALWVTIDLDFPRVGLVRMSDQPLVDARAAMGP
ncbi:MAG: hypothetical protein JNJ48_07745 [Phycisphaerae bacterium]|nr:hypothetical protein [Phycisphaerae bacterium]